VGAVDVATIERERPRLVALAYRLLGSAAEAEDVVQDALVRYAALDATQLHNPAAMLTTIVTRLALNVLGSARVRRESYEGPWLPEPVATPMDFDPGSISMAFMVLLESLGPNERAAFVLSKVFDATHEEIAEILGIEVAASRQLVHRARAHIDARKPRFRPAPEVHAKLVLEFLTACSLGDVDRLGRVLAADVVARVDHGGKVQAARRPVEGVDHVSRFVLGLVAKMGGQAGGQGGQVVGQVVGQVGASIEVASINGGPAILVAAGGMLISLLTFETDGDQLCEINIVRNPDKLAGLAAARGLAVEPGRSTALTPPQARRPTS
jgi:RNA polymerase sigma-70 factor (ECF subfamily)